MNPDLEEGIILNQVSVVARKVKELHDASAPDYGSQKGHGFCSVEERDAWMHVLKGLSIDENSACLEVGAGTGVLTELLGLSLNQSGTLYAQDFSLESIELNREHLTGKTEATLKYLEGDAHDRGVFSPIEDHSLDLIVARQSVVFFEDPIQVFKLWKGLLKAGGRAVILDALWDRFIWTGEWALLVESLPLSCPGSIRSMTYLMEQAGFSIESSYFLDEVNDCLGDSGARYPRFVIVARPN